MKKIIEIKLELPMKELNEFQNFQGHLKKLSESNLKKLKESIKRRGFNVPIFIWKNKNYILDGHARLIAIKELIKEGYSLEKNGIETSKLPFVEIEAKDKKEAGELVLQFSSEYHEMTEEGLKDFIKDFKLDIPELKLNLNLDINLTKVNEFNKENNTEKDNTENVEKLGNIVVQCPKCKHRFKRGIKNKEEIS